MKFNLQSADSLTGPRVYSTDLHPRTLERAYDAVSITRNLKIKLLTKGVVTINGGHLISPVAFDFVRKHPELLTESLLLPAIREDKGDFDAYVVDNQRAYEMAGWSSNRVDEAVSFLRESTKVVLPWTVAQAQERYRGRLTWGLSDDRSIARQQLLTVGGVTKDNLARLIDELSSADLSEDSIIDNLIVSHPEKAREIISRFSEAAYHQVGTSVVNCETGLDASELAQWRITHLLDSEVYGDVGLLTDTNVFLRCCFETAMEVINEAAFPIYVIDSLSFNAIGKIRVRLQDQGFQRAYDDVISTFTKKLVETNVNDIESWDVDITVSLVDQLTSYFRKYLSEELKLYRTDIQETKIDEAIRSSGETIKNSMGLVPGISELLSIVDVFGSGVKAASAAGQAYTFREKVMADAAARSKRDYNIDEALKKISPKNEAKILTGLRQMRLISAEYQKPF